MKELALQTFTIRSLLKDDTLESTLQAVREVGYSCLQLSGSLDEMERIGKAALRNGLKVCGSIASLETLLKDTKCAIHLHRELGADHTGISWHPYQTQQDVENFITAVNDLSTAFHREGLDFAYHNHAHEFRSFDGRRTIYDQLCRELNDETVSFMPDTYWLQYGGMDIRHVLQQLKGRIRVLHLKDMKQTANGPTFCEIGQGNLYWDGILAIAKDCNIRHYVVEQDECEISPLESIHISSRFLSSY